MKDNLCRILWGLVLVVFGIIWAVNRTGIAEINIFFDGWWTLFIIIPCIIGLVDEKENKTGELIGLLIGIALLLACRDILSFELIWELALPTIFIIIGLSMIFSNFLKSNITKAISNANEEGLEQIVATFGEQHVNKKQESFNGAKLDSVFGGIVLDLTDAKLKKETVIKASSIFGGITIYVPNDVEVKVKSTPIFGGVSNKAKNVDGAKKTIYIEALALFGGIDIK